MANLEDPNKLETEPIADPSEQNPEDPWAAFIARAEGVAGIAKEKLERAVESPEGESGLVSWLEASADTSINKVVQESENIVQKATESGLSEPQVTEIRTEVQEISARTLQAKNELDMAVAEVTNINGTQENRTDSPAEPQVESTENINEIELEVQKIIDSVPKYSDLSERTQEFLREHFGYDGSPIEEFLTNQDDKTRIEIRGEIAYRYRHNIMNYISRANGQLIEKFREGKISSDQYDQARKTIYQKNDEAESMFYRDGYLGDVDNSVRYYLSPSTYSPRFTKKRHDLLTLGLQRMRNDKAFSERIGNILKGYEDQLKRAKVTD